MRQVAASTCIELPDLRVSEKALLVSHTPTSKLSGASAPRLMARFDIASSSAGPQCHRLRHVRAERRYGVTRHEDNARAALQLRLDVAPPVSQPRTPLRQQRNLEERAQVRGTLKQVMSSLVVVGDSTFFFRSLPWEILR